MTNEAYEKMIRDDFKDHVATLSTWSDHIGPAMTLEWRRPGTGIYRIVYIIRGGLLIAWGDCGEAVYSWGGVPGGLTPAWLAELNLDYFAGKCEAWDSRLGDRGMEWDRELAAANIAERLAEYIAAYEDSEDADAASELREVHEEEIDDASQSSESACRFAHERLRRVRTHSQHADSLFVQRLY